MRGKSEELELETVETVPQPLSLHLSLNTQFFCFRDILELLNVITEFSLSLSHSLSQFKKCNVALKVASH